jgi:hypothetical protein
MFKHVCWIHCRLSICGYIWLKMSMFWLSVAAGVHVETLQTCFGRIRVHDQQACRAVRRRLAEGGPGGGAQLLAGLQREFRSKLARQPLLEWPTTLAALQLAGRQAEVAGLLNRGGRADAGAAQGFGIQVAASGDVRVWNTATDAIEASLHMLLPVVLLKDPPTACRRVNICRNFCEC